MATSLQPATCSQADHAEALSDPAGFGLVSIGRNDMGQWFNCGHCLTTLLDSAPACARCNDRGTVYVSDGTRSDGVDVKCEDCNPISKEVF